MSYRTRGCIHALCIGSLIRFSVPGEPRATNHVFFATSLADSHLESKQQIEDPSGFQATVSTIELNRPVLYIIIVN